MAKLKFVAQAEGDSSFTLKEVDIPAAAGGLGFKIAHASWDASAGNSFNWATDEIASLGVSNVVREKKGVYRVTFSQNFSSANYTITASTGSEDYNGVGASPRTLSVLLESQTASSVDVVCERTDDAVNEDNAYMGIIVIGS